jgi:hypothetical protein
MDGPRSSSAVAPSPSRSPFFGYDLSDYDVLFAEKLELFTRLLDEKPVTWQGTTRAPSTTPTSSPRRHPGT